MMRKWIAGFGPGMLAGVIALHAANGAPANERYDFRNAPEYAALTREDRVRLEQVHHDFVLLWGAMDLYVQDHDGQAPRRLEELTPLYLRVLPRDPFATDVSAAEPQIAPYKPSLDGRGYRYRPGVGTAWIIASVGLPGFPYLSAEGNIDLYIANGTWISGRQLAPVSE